MGSTSTCIWDWAIPKPLINDKNICQLIFWGGLIMRDKIHVRSIPGHGEIAVSI